MTEPNDPHGDQPVLTLGPPLSAARVVMIMVHGRGASAEDMLGLAAEIGAVGVTVLAPQAAGRTWYPYSFLSPIHENEPGITSGLGVLARLVESLRRTVSVQDGRTYAGGLTKFEPREMERLAVPDPFLVPEAVVEATA